MKRKRRVRAPVITIQEPFPTTVSNSKSSGQSSWCWRSRHADADDDHDDDQVMMLSARGWWWCRRVTRRCSRTAVRSKSRSRWRSWRRRKASGRCRWRRCGSCWGTNAKRKSKTRPRSTSRRRKLRNGKIDRWWTNGRENGRSRRKRKMRKHQRSQKRRKKKEPKLKKFLEDRAADEKDRCPSARTEEKEGEDKRKGKTTTRRNESKMNGKSSDYKRKRKEAQSNVRNKKKQTSKNETNGLYNWFENSTPIALWRTGSGVDKKSRDSNQRFRFRTFERLQKMQPSSSFPLIDPPLIFSAETLAALILCLLHLFCILLRFLRCLFQFLSCSAPPFFPYPQPRCLLFPFLQFFLLLLLLVPSLLLLPLLLPPPSVFLLFLFFSPLFCLFVAA